MRRLIRIMTVFVPNYFELYELVPPDVYQRYISHPHLLWGIFDDRLLRTISKLRFRYGSMVMNTWHWGGSHSERGWRHPDTITGATLSQHKFGRAGDLIPQETSAERIRQDIIAAPWHPDFEFITCIEMDIPWLHIDTRNRNKKRHGLLLIYP